MSTSPLAFHNANGEVQTDESSTSPSTKFESKDPIAASYSSDVQSSALREFKDRLCNVPHGKKSALVHVQRIRPDLVDNEHILRFLRVEDFNVGVSFVGNIAFLFFFVL